MSDQPRRGMAPRPEDEGTSPGSFAGRTPDYPSAPTRAYREPSRSYEPEPVPEAAPATPAYRAFIPEPAAPPTPAPTPAPTVEPIWYPPLPELNAPTTYPPLPPATPAYPLTAPVQPQTFPEPVPYTPEQLQIFAAPAPAPEPTPEPGRSPSPSAGPELDVPADKGGTFGQALGWTIAGTVLPGIGLIRGRRRAVGILTLLVFLALVGGLGYLVYESHLAVRVAMNPGAAIIIATACGMLAILASGMVLATYIANRPTRVTGGQRLLGSLVVGFLCLAVSAPLAVVAAVSYSQARLVSTLFATTSSATRPTIAIGPAGDLWAKTPRINVLLVSGNGATTDSMIVASTDTATGNTVLISVPRTTARLPFPESSPLRAIYPNGYWDGVSAQNPGSWASSIWANVPQKVPAQALGSTSNLGADALKLAIGEALGLRIDYYVYADVADLYTLIDAVGGVTLNVTSPIPAGASGAVERGAGRHLDANQTLAYAWTGSASDADLMLRQRCVVDAVIAQSGPMTVLRYAGVAQAGSKARTDVPQSMLAMLTELGARVWRGQVTSLQFSNGANGFDAANPDIGLMRQQVSAAVAGSVDATSAKNSPAVPIAEACAYT